MDSVEREEYYQMDSIETKDDEEPHQPHLPEPLCSEELNEDTRVHPRVGEEYQMAVPVLLTEVERLKQRSFPAHDSTKFDFEYPIGVGLAIPVTWTQNTSSHMKEKQRGFPGQSSCPLQVEDAIHDGGNVPGNLYQNNICSECLVCKAEDVEQAVKLLGSAGQDILCLQEKKFFGCSCAKREFADYIPLPGMPRVSWTNEEAEAFLLGLYIFGKKIVQVTKFTESKTIGEVLSYYYGKFFRSDAYMRWAVCRKSKSRACITGSRIFLGARQQELLSRLLASVPREVEAPLREVFKLFNEGTTTFEHFVLALRSTVGAQVLVEAVGIGKGKYDLTGFAFDPSRNHGISTRPKILIGKACSKLSSRDIIKFLTSDLKLSKARSNDLFWEVVWPRLLAKGWHLEQPYENHATVFLIPGVRKFSKRKLVKGYDYFDSVSDVLSKVASEPRLLKCGVVGGNNESDVKFGNGWVQDFEPDKKPPCSSRSSEPECSPELMEFMVVDTSHVQREEPFKMRSLRNLPMESSHGYRSSPHSRDSKSEGSKRQLNSDDSSPPYEVPMNTSGGDNIFVWSTSPNSTKDETTVCKQKFQNKHVIDLNIPQMPSDYESAASYKVPLSDRSTQTMDKPLRSSETEERADRLPNKDACRRHSRRSRPPTARALEAIACGFLGIKQKGREAKFPFSSKSSRPVRRPRRSADVTLPFSSGEGSTSHFTDPLMDVNERRMSNPQYQVINNRLSDKSTDKRSPDLFGKGKPTDKGAHEFSGMP